MTTARPRRKSRKPTHVNDAPAPDGYCERAHMHFYLLRSNAAFAGAVNMRGTRNTGAVKLIPCGDHWHYRFAVRVIR
jgi:hypothetical protein